MSISSVYWLTVKGRAEETDCAWCATPLLNGDRAICDEAWAEVFCSTPCLQRDRADQVRRRVRWRDRLRALNNLR
jgi:hypothetical protein